MVNAIKNSIAISHDRDCSVEGTAAAVTNPTKMMANGDAPHTSSMNSLNSFSGESKWTSVRRTAITTASFKTRKLPDDIPIIMSNPPSTPGPGSGGSLSSLKSTPPASQTTPPPIPSSNHNGHLALQNSKNLDSIDEECAERLLANGDAANSGAKVVGAAVKKPAKKNAVMNLLKELKESKQKLPKMGSGKENGKLLNNSNNRNSKDRDSDSSGLPDGKITLADGEDDEMIPMRRLNKYIDDDTTTNEDEEDEDRDELDGNDLDEINCTSVELLGEHRNGTTADDDEGTSSDRSGVSSQGLLAASSNAKKSENSKNSTNVKLPVQ